MDNLIKKFNEELKYCFPESRLEVVLLKTSLSESKGIDIRGDLNVMEFYKFLNFNKIWITENLQKYFHVENWKDYNVHPQKAGLGTFTKIAFTNEEAQKRGCMNMQYFDPILYTEVVFTETTEFKVQHPLLLLPKSLNFQSRNSSINTLLLMVLLLLFSAFQSIRLMIILSQKDILPLAFTAYTLMPFMT